MNDKNSISAMGLGHQKLRRAFVKHLKEKEAEEKINTVRTYITQQLNYEAIPVAPRATTDRSDRQRIPKVDR